MSMPFDEYLTVQEAAKVLGVSPWTLRNWDNTGKVASERHPVSGYRIYRREKLEALLKLGDPRQKKLEDPTENRKPGGDGEHFVQLYERDETLVEAVAAFSANALKNGEAVILIATAQHTECIERQLINLKVDAAALKKTGQYSCYDAAATLADLMKQGRPSAELFEQHVGTKIRRLRERWPKVRAFGEMVALLWADGKRDSAIALEELWNDLAKTETFTLCCAYPISGFQEDADSQALMDVCDCHTRAIPAESLTGLTPADQERAIIELQHKAQRLEREMAKRAKAERELSDFLESALEGLHKVGPDGRILWANKAELDLLGYSASEYIGRNIADFHVDQGVIHDMLCRLKEGQTLMNQPARLRAKNGAIKEVLIHSNPYFEDGQFVYSRCFSRDVTDIARAEQGRKNSETRLRGLLRALPIGVYTCEAPSGKLTYWNEQAVQLWGRSPQAGATNERFCGSYKIYMPDGTQVSHDDCPMALAVTKGQQFRNVEVIVERPDGTRIMALVNIEPIYDEDGKLIAAVNCFQDITALKTIEQKLKEADRNKDEFLATLAHELRNPLAPINNSLQVLGRYPQHPPETQKLHGMIQRQVKHLVRLVDDLMEVSRISRGRIELHKQRVTLAEVLNHAVETSRPLIDASGHTLQIQMPATPILLNADMVRLSQVFCNLLNNAAKYTDKNGSIVLTARREGQEAVISLQDTGIGIPRELLTRVFDIFVRGDNTHRRKQDGLGIGLSLAKKVVELHHGQIYAASAGPGMGSEFIVRLPLSADELNHSHSELAPDNARPLSGRVLVVDDNVDSADTLGMMLELLGATVEIAYDGVSALQKLETVQPQVVVMDLGMPGLDGFETARQIRINPAHKDVRLIAITGWGQAEDRRRSREAGFNAHLVKPVDLDALRWVFASDRRAM